MLKIRSRGEMGSSCNSQGERNGERKSVDVDEVRVDDWMLEVDDYLAQDEEVV